MPDDDPPAPVVEAARIALAQVSPGGALAFAEVFRLDGARAYWLVGAGSPQGLQGLARIRDDGKVLTVGALRAPARDCAAAATGLDAAGARALARGAAPVLVQDGPVGREAWLLRDDAGQPLLLATGGGTYERSRSG